MTVLILEAARNAYANGLCPIPAANDGSKRPGLAAWKQYQSGRPDPTTIEKWFSGGADGLGLVCGAISGNLEMLEFEGRAADEGILEEFDRTAHAAGCFDVLERIMAGYTERTPSGGLHLLYRCETIDTNLKLARRPATPEELETKPGDTIKVLIETRAEGGFTVCAPSGGKTHPTGRPWELLAGSFATIATITPDERALLFEVARSFDQLPAADTTPREQHHQPVGEHRPGDDYNQHADWDDVLLPHGWVRVGQHGWRRPGKKLGVSASTATGSLVVFSTSTVFDTNRGYTPFTAYTLLNHNGDYTTAAKTLRDAGYGQQHTPNHTTPPGAHHDPSDPGPTPPPPDPNAADPGPVNDLPVLPERFWTARPELGHIRQAARSLLIAPDALLGATLARICQHTLPQLVIPPLVGRVGSLNLTVGLVGHSGAGKGSVADASLHLLRPPTHNLGFNTGEANAGSGEGMVRAYFDLKPDPDDKRRKLLARGRDSMLIRVDEGETLRNLAQRQGQTTWQTVRSAFSGERLGGSYVDENRQSRLEPHTYRMALLIGIQPTLAGFLLDDAAGGTPQRICWFTTIDPDAPEADEIITHPGPLNWTPPTIHDPDIQTLLHDPVGDGLRRAPIGVDDSIRHELRLRRISELQTGGPTDPLDSHLGLTQLKLAALLAILDHRLHINPEDWHLAIIITDTGKAVRDWMRQTIKTEADRKDHAANERAAQRAARVKTAEAAAGTTIQRVAVVVARHIHRHAQDDSYEGCNRRCIGRAVASRDRDELDAALGHATTTRWAVFSDDRQYRPGPENPA